MKILSEIADDEYNSEDSDIGPVRRKVHVLDVLLSLLSNEEEIEIGENNGDWSELDPEKHNEQFKGVAGEKIFPDNPQIVTDVMSLFVGDNLFEKIVLEINRYHNANSHRYKNSAHRSKWIDVTVPEMKKVFALIIIMEIRKNKIGPQIHL